MANECGFSVTICCFSCWINNRKVCTVLQYMSRKCDWVFSLLFFHLELCFFILVTYKSHILTINISVNKRMIFFCIVFIFLIRDYFILFLVLSYNSHILKDSKVIFKPSEFNYIFGTNGLIIKFSLEILINFSLREIKVWTDSLFVTKVLCCCWLCSWVCDVNLIFKNA